MTESFKAYANSFQTESKLRLEGIGMLTEKTGNPHKDMKFIHIAGTNGKGSVCAFLQSILTASGLKTGKYISPNMIDVCERISIDGKNIEHEEMDSLLDEVGRAAEEIRREKGEMPTQFEIWTAAAFLYFRRKNCDIVVLETGLGGRLDATNIIDAPLCSVITHIDIDHTSYLGDTLGKIAAEKAGIIKQGCPVITAIQHKEAADVLIKTAKDKKSEIITAAECVSSGHCAMTEIFDYKDMKNLEINLAGIHQLENASLAIEAARLVGIDDKYIMSGLKKAVNIGRFEKLSDEPVIIFDGAHNLSGTVTLADAIERYFPERTISLVYGAMADKDIMASAKYLHRRKFSENTKVFTVTVLDNPRAQTADKLAEIFSDCGFDAYPCDNLSEAVDKASQTGDITVICGSLYLYKDLKTTTKY